MASFLPHLVLDVGELGVVLVVLLVLRAVDRCVQSSFHGWCLCGDIIADSVVKLMVILEVPQFFRGWRGAPAPSATFAMPLPDGEAKRCRPPE